MKLEVKEGAYLDLSDMRMEDVKQREKVDPTPFSDSTMISPPKALAIYLLSFNPNPQPY